MSDEPKTKAPLTIGNLERDRGIAGNAAGESALEKWYAGIRDKPLTDLSDADLCRCCRQCIFPELVVPYVVERIEANPLAGELYDGEMLVAVSDVAEQFWAAHKSLAAKLARILSRPIAIDDLSVVAAIRMLQSKIHPTPPAH